MINQLKLGISCMEIWAVLIFQVLEITYLSHLNQITFIQKEDFLQQFIMVVHISITYITFKDIVYIIQIFYI